MELKTSETGRPPRFKMEFIIAVSVIVVSVMSMVVAIYQTQIMRDQQHTAVWPYIQWMMQTGPNGFSIVVTNKGVGPAIIKSTSLKLDGKPMQNVDSLLIKIFGKLDGLNIDESEINNQVIAAGEKFVYSMSLTILELQHR